MREEIEFALGLIRQWTTNVCADQASDLKQALGILEREIHVLTTVNVEVQELVDISGVPQWVPTLYTSLAEAREANPRTPPNFFRAKR